jgi:hypothetical protein
MTWLTILRIAGTPWWLVLAFVFRRSLVEAPISRQAGL